MKSLVLAVAACGLLATAPAAALAKPRVKFAGCPTPDTAHPECVIVKSGDKTYNVSLAQPPIHYNGLGITGSGVVEGVSYCREGEMLIEISYKYTLEPCAVPKQAPPKRP
ncbi:MAG TPA: hypothetical protein VGG29_14675 [Caulobacteraceae bacterium]